jgi:acetyltransferase-like isoleucine patch superfamily enzyme
MEQGNHCRIGNNVTFAEDTVLGNNVTIGNNVTFYSKVTIGDGCRILDGAVLGRLPLRTRIQNLDVITEYVPFKMGPGSILGCHSVLYSGVDIGENVAIHDHCVIRENCEIGDDVLMGRNILSQARLQIKARARITDFVELAGLVEEDVFISPGVMMADDPNAYITRFRQGQTLDYRGPIIRRYAMIGPNATLLPYVEVGEGAQVAAGAVVTKDVAPWTIAVGIPARVVRDVDPAWREEILEYGRKQK